MTKTPQELAATEAYLNARKQQAKVLNDTQRLATYRATIAKRRKLGHQIANAIKKRGPMSAKHLMELLKNHEDMTHVRAALTQACQDLILFKRASGRTGVPWLYDVITAHNAEFQFDYDDGDIAIAG